MKLILFSASLVLAANFAMAQSSSTNIADATTSESTAKDNPGEPITSAGSLNSPLARPTSMWRHKMSYTAYYGMWNSTQEINHDSTKDTAVDLFVQAMRDIGKGQSLGVRVNGAQNQTNDSARTSYETRIIDPQIMYKNPAFGSTLRLSLPVAASSQKVGRYELRYNGGADVYTNGRFTLGLAPEARIYAYSVSSVGERLARFRAIASPSYKLSDRLSIFNNTYYDVRYNNSGKGYQYLYGAGKGDLAGGKVDPRNLDRYAVLELGLSINAIPKTLLIEPYIQQYQSFEKSDWSLFNEASTYYNLEFTLTM